MNTYLVPPKADHGPNVQTPVGAAAHYDCVDENPNDGDATYLRILATGREVFYLDVSAVPDNALIRNVRVRVTQKQTTAGQNTFQAGLLLPGGEHFGAVHTRDVGSAYLTDEDAFPLNPDTGLAWTKDELGGALLAHQQLSLAQGLPSPRITQVVVLADAVPHPAWAHAEGVSVLSPAAGTPEIIDPTGTED